MPPVREGNLKVGYFVGSEIRFSNQTVAQGREVDLASVALALVSLEASSPEGERGVLVGVGALPTAVETKRLPREFAMEFRVEGQAVAGSEEEFARDVVARLLQMHEAGMTTPGVPQRAPEQ